jgi:hypothetical protein
MKRLISAALVATAMGLTLCGCEDKSSPSTDKTTAEKAVDSVKEQGKKAADATKEAATKAVDATKEAASDLKDKATGATTSTPPAAAPKTGTAPIAPAPTPSTAPPPAPPPAPASGSADVPATATTAMKDYLASLTGITQKASAISSPTDAATAMPDLKSLTSKLQDSWSKLDSLAPGTKDKLKGMFADQLKPATSAYEAQVKRLSEMPGMSSVSDMLKGVKLFK